MKYLKATITALIISLGLGISASAQTFLTSIDGERVDIQGQRGKVVILAIGASWLPLSGKQAEYTNALAKKYAGRDVAIYFIATDSNSQRSRNFASNESIAKFATSNKLAVPVLRDSDGAATLKRFSIDQLPTFVVLDKQGNMAGKPFGGIDPKFDITVPISRTVDGLL
ncbi:MAG TPA: TlpA disulfide reductase family protein [Pyrinomonadaceae bacterium]|nr:TlpA disulfide reductase family protein [Pyrinomonadaceae bacterium]HMP66946.1 TlpA disulfide reductase family protein [Pyrinomonadaceae bacterium]